MHHLRIILLLAITQMITIHIHGENSTEIAPDSSNFIKASLIVITPTDIIYSSLGHCAIRMECPSENLDYCFSLETDVQPSEYVRFFNGETRAAVRAIPSKTYIQEFQHQGRGITQYELNLTTREKQLLWKNLDEEMMKPPHLKFNFLNTNCVMMVVIMIQNALIDEHINYGQLPSYVTGDNGNSVRQLTSSTPWYKFIYITLYGSNCDKSVALEYRLSPMKLPEVYSNAHIEGNNGLRTLLKGQPLVLAKQTNFMKASPVTPLIFFSSILVLVIIITIGEWQWGWKRAAHITDTVLLAVEFIMGIILTYMSVVSNLFPSHWNWYLIPCNPLPMLYLLLWGKKEHFGRIYLFYTLVLILFILATPLSSQLDIDHQLITAMFSVRTWSKYRQYKKDHSKQRLYVKRK